MIEEEASVIEVREHRALVSTVRTSACESCSARSGCGSLGGGREARVWADDHVGVERGDQVIVAVGEGSLLKASVLVYLMPTAALVAGAVLGDMVGEKFGYPPDLTAAGLGLASMVGAFFVAKALGRRMVAAPAIIRRAGDGKEA